MNGGAFTWFIAYERETSIYDNWLLKHKKIVSVRTLWGIFFLPDGQLISHVTVIFLIASSSGFSVHGLMQTVTL